MSLLKSSTVDLVTVHPVTGQTNLLILDDAPWTDADVGERLLQLQEKLNGYISGIESGEIFEKFPNGRREGLAIVYMSPRLPPVEASSFFNAARKLLQGMGIGLLIEVNDGT